MVTPQNPKKKNYSHPSLVVALFALLFVAQQLSGASAVEPRVQQQWQSAFVSHLKTFAPAQADLEVWGLFTYGGWSDSGQYLAISQGGEHHFYFIPPNYLAGGGKTKNQPIFRPEREKAKDSWVLDHKGWEHFRQPLDPSQWQGLEKAAGEFMGLEDLSARVFDGLEVEFIHGRRLKGELHIDKRVFFNNPDEKTGKRHRDALERFFKVGLALPKEPAATPAAKKS
jgi:hypothetical protein